MLNSNCFFKTKTEIAYKAEFITNDRKETIIVTFYSTYKLIFHKENADNFKEFQKVLCNLKEMIILKTKEKLDKIQYTFYTSIKKIVSKNQLSDINIDKLKMIEHSVFDDYLPEILENAIKNKMKEFLKTKEEIKKAKPAPVPDKVAQDYCNPTNKLNCTIF